MTPASEIGRLPYEVSVRRAIAVLMLNDCGTRIIKQAGRMDFTALLALVASLKLERSSGLRKPPQTQPSGLSSWLL